MRIRTYTRFDTIILWFVCLDLLIVGIILWPHELPAVHQGEAPKTHAGGQYLVLGALLLFVILLSDWSDKRRDRRKQRQQRG